MASLPACLPALQSPPGYHYWHPADLPSPLPPQVDTQIDDDLQRVLAFLASPESAQPEAVLAQAMALGEVNFRVMALLDKGHTSRWGGGLCCAVCCCVCLPACLPTGAVQQSTSSHISLTCHLPCPPLPPRYGNPVPTQVRTTPVAGKAILISGHDMHDLEDLLRQTEGTGGWHLGLAGVLCCSVCCAVGANCLWLWLTL